MKYLQLFSTVVVVCVAGLVCGSSQADHFKVFLLGGQSNMDGRADESGLAPSLQIPQSDVLFYEGGNLRNLQPGSGSDFGPEITFGRTIADALPDEHFVLIKFAVSGTDLHNDWDPTAGSTYTSFRNTVTNGLSALTMGVNTGNTYEIAGMLWTQGERDAIIARSEAQYEADLTEFIGDIRVRYGSDLPFFLSRLSINQGINASNLAEIYNAQTDVATTDANAYLIDTDTLDLLDNDTKHFSADGQIALGEAFAQSYLGTVPEPSTLALIGAGGFLLTRRRRNQATRC